jgi:hypothetical protein
MFQTAKGDRFPVRLPKDEEGNLLVNKEDSERLVVAHQSGGLFFPFKCELCHFRNLQDRSPMDGAGKLGDI